MTRRLPKRPTAEAKPRAVSSEPLDLSALQELVGHDPNLQRRFLKKFVEAAPATIQQIQAAHAKRSASEVGMAAHKLKSSARAVGANTLADLCQSLEKAGKANNWKEIDNLKPHLRGLLTSVEDQIRRLLSA